MNPHHKWLRQLPDEATKSRCRGWMRGGAIKKEE